MSTAEIDRVMARLLKRRVAEEGGDEGFTLIEAVFAVVLIALIMFALSGMFSEAITATNSSRMRQEAAMLGDAALDQVRALAPSDLVFGRSAASVNTQWSNEQSSPVPGVVLSDMVQASDSDTSDTTPALPTTATTQTVNNTAYAINWYIGTCYQPAAGGDCTASDATGYITFYRAEVAVTWNAPGKCGGSGCAYVTSTLVNADSDSLYNLDATAPGVIPTLTAIASSSSITLTWSVPSNGGSPITGYNIYETSPGTLLVNSTPIPSSSICTTTTCTYTITGLTNGTSYSFTVSGVNSIGVATESAEESANAGAPSAPVLDTATEGNTSVALTWTAPGSNGGSAVTGYDIYEGTTSGGESTTPLNSSPISSSATSYTVTGLTNGTTYFFTLAAINPYVGVPSNELSATPLGPPGSPTLNSAVSTASGQVTLSWTAPTSTGGTPVTGYYVYDGTSSGGESTHALNTTAISSTATSYTVTGLTNGRVYYFVLAAANAVGVGTQSNEASVAVGTPGAPTLTGVTAVTTAGGQITLTWTAPSTNGAGALTGYYIYKGTSTGGESTTALNSSAITSTSYTVTGLANNTTYYFVVAAANSVGVGPTSNEGSATTPTTPGAPTGITATAVTTAAGQITVAWTAPSSNGGASITGYYVYQGTSSGGESTTPVNSTATSSTSYTVTGLSNNTTYYFKVAAVNGPGTGTKSTEASATTPTTPGIPTALTATSGNTTVGLSWTAPSSTGGAPITSYNLYRSTTSGSGFSLISSVTASSACSGSTCSFTNTSLTNGTAYYYEVAAVNPVGASSNSSQASATPAAPPSAPTALVATPGNTDIVLTWSVPSSTGGATITTYNIYRSTSSSGPFTVDSSPSATTACSAGGCTFTDYSLTNGTTYYYYVAAVNSAGMGTASSTTSATPVTLPGAPSLTSVAGGNTKAVLTWSIPSSNGGAAITTYNIYRSTTSGGPFALDTSVSPASVCTGSTCTYNDTGLTGGTTYYYEITAVNSVGEGPTSSQGSGAVTSVPGSITSLDAVGVTGGSALNLTWTAPTTGGSAITSYIVYEGTSSTSITTVVSSSNISIVSATDYNITGLTNGTTYYFEVAAVNAVGTGPKSNPTSAAPATLPGAPTLTNVAGGNTQAVLTWSIPSSNGGAAITAYNVYRSTTTGGPYALDTAVSPASVCTGSTCTYTDTGLTGGTTYYYKISAVNSAGEGSTSAQGTATVDAVPGSITTLNATAVTTTSGEVNLAWTAPSTGGSAITSYIVYEGTTSNPTAVVSSSNISIVSATNYNITGLTNGTTYYFEVAPVNAVGTGPNSNSDNAVPGTVPGAVTTLNATAQTSPAGEINLAWTAPSTGGLPITSYIVYEGTSSTSITTVVGSSNISIVSATNYNVTGLSNGTTYYFEVAAVNAAGTGPKSNYDDDTTPSLPGSITTLNATAQTSPAGEINLTWTAPSTGGSPITSYIVYEGTSSTSITTVVGSSNISIVSATNYNVTGLSNGTTYYFEVAPVNAVGTGPKSNSDNDTTPSLPGSITTLNATAQTSPAGEINLAWTAPSTGGSPITSYIVYEGTSSTSITTVVSSSNISIVSATNYNVTGLSNGTTYYFEVAPVNAVGTGPKSNSDNDTTPSLPGSITTLNATAVTTTGGEINLAWTAPSTGGSPITSYIVYEGTSSTSITTVVSSSNISIVSATNYNITGLSNGTTYYFEVAPVNAVGTGPKSNSDHDTTPSLPGSITTLNANGVPTVSGEVNVTWTAPSTGGSAITSYIVYEGTTSNPTTVVSSSNISIVSATNYNITGLSNGTTYYFEVAPVNAVGTGPKSNSDPATPGVVPGVPTSVTATGSGTTQINLAWSAPTSSGTGSITGYNVYKSSSATGTYTKVNSSVITTRTDSITGLTANTTFYFEVTAVNSYGEGSPCAYVSAKS